MLLLRKYSFIHFSPKGNTFVSLFFIFFTMVFTKITSKSTSGINFSPNVSSPKRSLISSYELLFQRCMLIYDVNESVNEDALFVWVVSHQTEVAVFGIIQKCSLIKFFIVSALNNHWFKPLGTRSLKSTYELVIVGKSKVLGSNHHPSIDKNVCKAIMKLSAFKQKASRTKQKIDFRKYKKQRNLVNKSKEVYRRNAASKNSYCKCLIILFAWSVTFFTCLQLIVFQNPLVQWFIFVLPRTFKSSKENVLCLPLLNVEEQIESYRTKLLFFFQENSVNYVKVLSYFYKNASFGYLEN